MIYALLPLTAHEARMAQTAHLSLIASLLMPTSSILLQRIG
jgi:hypothetical protein